MIQIEIMLLVNRLSLLINCELSTSDCFFKLECPFFASLAVSVNYFDLRFVFLETNLELGDFETSCRNASLHILIPNPIWMERRVIVFDSWISQSMNHVNINA